MSERNFTRTLITLVVLSEEPIPEDESLGSILEGADTGPYVLGAVGKTADALDYQAMRQELLEAGNDGTFFDLEDEVAVAPTRYYEPPADQRHVRADHGRTSSGGVRDGRPADQAVGRAAFMRGATTGERLLPIAVGVRFGLLGRGMRVHAFGPNGVWMAENGHKTTALCGRKGVAKLLTKQIHPAEAVCVDCREHARPVT